MEVAGLVLSVVALFSSCLKGYQLVSDVKSGEHDSAILLCRLQIEEKRLMIWGKTVGLAEETCRIPIQDIDMIVTVLAEINRRSSDEEEIRISKALQSTWIFAVESTKKLRSPGQSLKNGLRWVFDRKNFEKLVVDLRELNNGLYALLEGAQRLSSLSRFNEICLLSSASDDVNRLAVIRDASSTSYEGLSRTVDQRMHFFKLEQSSIEVPQLGTLIPVDQLDWVRSESLRGIAHFEDEMVLVEWRGYADENYDGQLVLTVLEQRIAELSVLLGRKPKPEGFQVMNCIGYCHDEPKQRFGLVYNLPVLEADEPPEIVSLYDLIHSQADADKVFPSLNDRFLLSRILANSLLQLHTTCWLHRNLRSSHILFVKSGKSMDWLQYPYLSGFGYSRLNNPKVVSLPVRPEDEEMAYQHPDLTDDPRVGYRRDYDAYSLGIILTEIGFWRPIFKFRKLDYSANRNHRRLLEYQLTGHLAHRMGQHFEQAAKLLLTGKAYGDSKVEGEQLIAFSRNIVSQLDIQNLH
ncbi:hypothetical protein N7478_007011 [Penicillium angulare]|uniref:uncharacterized protein n=1 Tax=Penicillium angulare TaxID=116970 RepID=UPI0025423089|nr:uncharacterized protein N7478_007011 [Penicillium angulare]KAJ5281639.1 hypothetical protein N7478_007011 [Penicillium angulare]